jgi:hypothetical protein
VPRCPALVLGLLLRVSCSPSLFLGRHRRPLVYRGLVRGYDVLDDVSLVFRRPPSRGYGDDVAGSDGRVGIMDKVGFRRVEELGGRGSKSLNADMAFPWRRLAKGG